MGAGAAAAPSACCVPASVLLLLLVALLLLGDGCPCVRAAVDTGGLSRAAFPKGFVFGTAASAYQVEGMAASGGRGPCIWDPFVHTPGNIAGNTNADVSTDEYHRYKEDVDLMKSLNFDAYRFSISWSRIFPDGEGRVNTEGVAYYNNLIDYVLKQGLTPYVNLNHYDLPLALQKKYEGWLSPKIIDKFVDYAEFCFKTYGDRVRNWFTFNEPRIVAALGYDTGTNPLTDAPNVLLVGTQQQSLTPLLITFSYLMPMQLRDIAISTRYCLLKKEK